WAAIESIAEKIGCSSDTLRRWVRQAERDEGKRPGARTAELERIKGLERENRELRRANEILRKAAAFFAHTPSPNWSGHLGEVMLNLFEEEENGGISQGRRWAPAVHDRLQEGADRPRPPGRDYAFGACA